MRSNERQTGVELLSLAEPVGPLTSDAAASPRRDVGRLLALEWVQVALGVSLLVMIAARAVSAPRDGVDASTVAIVGMLALLALTAGLRARLGRAALRRDVQELTLLCDLASPRLTDHDSPYRGRVLPPIRAAVTRLRRVRIDRRRRWSSGSRTKRRQAM